MPVNITVTNKPRIVIVGGGFGGIEFAKKLKHEDVQVVLLDKNNYHTFQPLLYQVATSGLEPDSIAFPLRKIFKTQSNFVFRMGEVFKIHPEIRTIETSIGDIVYDYLILATGSQTNFFGMEDIQRNSVPMKSIPQALDLRSIILQNFEKALLTVDLEERDSLMTFVVVGGGPTGVETAGALGELKNHILPRDYPELDMNKMQIHVIEKTGRIFSTMSPSASVKGEEFLKRFDVTLWLNTGIQSYDGKKVVLSNGKTLISTTVIWAAGVKGAVLDGLKPETIQSIRVKVDQYNRVLGYENIFAVGDVAAMMTEKNPHGHPMLAPVAIQQGKQLADNIKRILKKKSLKPFVYRSLGVMATVGRNRAVVDLPFIKFQGTFAWFVWMSVHLMTLVGFRNRLVVFVNWMWNYFSYDRGLRLIIPPVKRVVDGRQG